MHILDREKYISVTEILFTVKLRILTKTKIHIIYIFDILIGPSEHTFEFFHLKIQIIESFFSENYSHKTLCFTVL